jgi:hypothetical protein
VSLTPEQTAVMEALVESNDSRVSARDRIDAARVLADAGASAEPEGAAILIRKVAARSDVQLARELEMHFGPEVERRVDEELRRRGEALDAREAALDEREARFAAIGLAEAERAASERADGSSAV